MSSISLLRKEKQRANNKNNLKEVANICNLLGIELLEARKYDEALQEHKEEERLFEALKDTIGVAIAHRKQGEVYCEIHQWEKALKHQNTHLALALKDGDPVEEQRAYATIGRTHMQRSEVAIQEENKELQRTSLAESERAFLKALGTCQKIGDKVDGKELAQMRCRVYHNLGLVVDLKGETTDAIKFVSQSLELCLQYEFTEDAFRSYSELSKMHLKEGKLDKASEEANLSLKFGLKLHKKNFIADSHLLISQIQLAKEDYLGAKKSCYKAYKGKHPDDGARQAIQKMLKRIVNICNTREEMAKPETDDETRLKYLDKIGDSCSNLGLYKQAIHFYEQRLNLALENGKNGSFLAPIYISLAQTYKDLKQYGKALDYFNKELNIHLNANYKEAIITLIEMAKISENMSSSYDKIADFYDQALQIAEKFALHKYQGIIIQTYITMSDLPAEKKEILEGQLNELQSRLGDDFEFEISDNSDESESEDIDLDDIEFSDSDEEKVVSKRPRRGTSSLQLKVNAIGESPLHRAVIGGNVSTVRKLLENKHPVNVRDNNGWLPIHEACNWGFRDIAELLIDAGAWMNDKGGRGCAGTTPLHDAATNCHLDVMRLLIERGASILAKNDEGKTPLDCLVKFTDQKNLNDEDLVEFDIIKMLLIERMERAGQKVPSSLKITKPNNINNSGRKLSRRTSDKLLEVDEDELPDLDYTSGSESTFISNYTLRNSQTNSATETYRTAMKDVGSHARRVDVAQPSSSHKEIAIPSLLPENEYVINDWLIDDQETSKKRKRSIDPFDIDYKEKSRRSNEFDKEEKSRLNGFEYKENSFSSSNIISTAKKKSKQPKLTTMLKKSSLNRSMSNMNTFPNHSDSPEKDDETDIFYSLQINNNNNKSSRITLHNSSHDISHNPPICLQVKVLQNRISVPIAFTAQSNTISWLEEEVSKRYLQLSGVRRILKLFSLNGDALNSDDIISQVLSSDNRELKATVTGTRDFDSMSVIYNKICRNIGSTSYTDISSKLKDCESLGGIDFSKLSIRNVEQFKPILTSIQFQNIQNLNFNSCRLGDVGMMELIQSLPSLPLVEKLEVEACSITAKSFISLLNFLTEQNSTLIRISNFSLSYNDFSRVTFFNFLDFLSLPTLRELKVLACDLTFLMGANNITSNVTSLYLDENQIGLKSLSTIMSSCLRLTHFSIRDCVPSARNLNDPSLGSALSFILGYGDHCLLEHLDIASCNVTSEDIDIISTYLYRCSVITSLNLSENLHISSNSIMNLLKELSGCLFSTLKSLQIHGIKALENDAAFTQGLADVIEKKSASACPFVDISLPNTKSSELIKELWSKLYKNDAIIKCLSNVSFLKLRQKL